MTIPRSNPFDPIKNCDRPTGAKAASISGSPSSANPLTLVGSTDTLSPELKKGLAYYHPQTATHLLSIDLDGTLTSDIKGAVDFQKSHKNYLFHLNTGRTLEDIQGMASYLKDLEIYALSTGNGEGLYINHDHLPGNEFIKQLGKAYQQGVIKQDPGWQSLLLEKTGWDHAKAVSIIQQAVDQGWASPGYGATEVQVQDKEKAKTILTQLEAKGIQADLTIEDGYLYKFGPKNTKKNTPIEFLTQQCPQLKGIVVAGDSDNDLSMMALNTVSQTSSNGSGSSREIPVLKVAMAGRAAFVDKVKSLTQEKGVIYGSSKQTLFQCIENQWNTLENAPKLATPDQVQFGESTAAKLHRPNLTIAPSPDNTQSPSEGSSQAAQSGNFFSRLVNSFVSFINKFFQLFGF
jgi:hydroxymethylpyrimidine pyrophosphatase-like HAD family hydrolase